MNRYRVELFQERDSTQQMSGYRISLEGDKWLVIDNNTGLTAAVFSAKESAEDYLDNLPPED